MLHGVLAVFQNYKEGGDGDDDEAEGKAGRAAKEAARAKAAPPSAATAWVLATKT